MIDRSCINHPDRRGKILGQTKNERSPRNIYFCEECAKDLEGKQGETIVIGGGK